jgi:hypothetical protein
MQDPDAHRYLTPLQRKASTRAEAGRRDALIPGSLEGGWHEPAAKNGPAECV